jgi:peroxiredoxin/predicted negative regulator of RcsB-dependent stress response
VIFRNSLSVLAVAGCVLASPARCAEPAPASVAEIQAKHDRAFIQELAEYVRKNPRAADRDQAYAALFNKAIEHDWFAETEELGRQYLKSDPDGPVKALAQIVLTMARAQAGQFDLALARYRELMQGLNQNEQEEFAASFSEDLAALAITAGEFTAAREVYTSLLARFSESPNLRQKVQAELKRLDRVGKPAPAFAAEDIKGKPIRLAACRGKYVLIDFWATWCAPCVSELPRLQAAYRTYHDAGFEIIAVSLDENKTAAADFVKVRDLPWPQLHNASSSADLVDAFGVITIPATYLIDPEGTIVRLDLRGKTLDETLRRLLKRTAAVDQKRR